MNSTLQNAREDDYLEDAGEDAPLWLSPLVILVVFVLQRVFYGEPKRRKKFLDTDQFS